MNLQNEYAKRHGIPHCLLAGHEGLLLLSDFCGNTIAAHTAIRPKTHQLCAHCHNSSEMVLELITIGSRGPHVISHDHIEPDANLILAIHKITGENTYLPIPLNNPMEIESFIWANYKNKSTLITNPYWLEANLPNGERQMLYCALRFSNIYSIFMHTLQFLTAGRKYLLTS